jgi:hypothetical protein
VATATITLQILIKSRSSISKYIQCNPFFPKFSKLSMKENLEKEFKNVLQNNYGHCLNSELSPSSNKSKTIDYKK